MVGFGHEFALLPCCSEDMNAVVPQDDGVTLRICANSLGYLVTKQVILTFILHDGNYQFFVKVPRSLLDVIENSLKKGTL